MYIYSNPHKANYLAAIQELEQRKAEWNFLTRRIEQLEELIRSLEPLAKDDEAGAPTVGLPEMCAQILRGFPKTELVASDIVDGLRLRGVDISGYSNPLAVLHTTLTRLCRPGSGFVKGRSDFGPTYVFDPDSMNDAYRSGMRR
jgi:hypothetical protein